MTEIIVYSYNCQEIDFIIEDLIVFLYKKI